MGDRVPTPWEERLSSLRPRRTGWGVWREMGDAEAPSGTLKGLYCCHVGWVSPHRPRGGGAEREAGASRGRKGVADIEAFSGTAALTPDPDHRGEGGGKGGEHAMGTSRGPLEQGTRGHGSGIAGCRARGLAGQRRSVQEQRIQGGILTGEGMSHPNRSLRTTRTRAAPRIAPRPGPRPSREAVRTRSSRPANRPRPGPGTSLRLRRTNGT